MRECVITSKQFECGGHMTAFGGRFSFRPVGSGAHTQDFGFAWQGLLLTVPPHQPPRFLCLIFNHYTDKPNSFQRREVYLPPTLEVQGHSAVIKVALETVT